MAGHTDTHTHRQTDRQTDRVKTIPRNPLRGRGNYKLYLQTYNNTIRQAIHNYFRQKLDDNKDNVKNTWKSLINKENDKSTFPQAFFIDNNYTSKKKNIADGFNKFYSTIGMKTQQSVLICNKHFTDYLNNPNVNKIFMDLVDDNEIVNIVNKFKPKMSSGHDGIPTKIFKLSIFSILSPLKHLINLSLLTGIFPNDLKIARVMPIYKSADKDQLKNYRPISLLPAFSKVFEKVMYNKIMNYFYSNNLFYQHQYGFRPKRTTSHPIIQLLNKCASDNNLKPKHLIAAILCDLSKAFDVFNHNILIRKLDHYGIRCIAKPGWYII